MDILNTSLAVLAIVISIYAIWFSKKLADKSNSIALISQRTQCYKDLLNLIDTYGPMNQFNNMLHSKNAHIVFAEQLKSRFPLSNMVFGQLGKLPDFRTITEAFNRINSDITMLTINKNLFKKEKIYLDNIISNLEKLKKDLTDSLTSQKDSDNLILLLEDLTNNLETIKNILLPKLLENISN